ncbi:hypothetical protein ACIBVN_54495, partial [Nonomuraea sp. NPDC049400]
MPAVRAAPSMTRYSLTAWQAIMAASWTMSLVRASRFPWRRTSQGHDVRTAVAGRAVRRAPAQIAAQLRLRPGD